MSNLLEVRDLEVAYGQSLAVRGATFQVGAGELVTIIGANGAGKTTTLRALMGLHRPRSGQIFFDGVEVTSEPAYLRNPSARSQAFNDANMDIIEMRTQVDW